MRRKTDKQFKQEVYDLVGNEYTVLDTYSKSGVKLHIRHNKCGFVNYVTPAHFLSKPTCNMCSHRVKWNTSSFREHVKQLTNGEYIFIGPYEGSKIPSLFKHLSCGNKFKMRPNAFSNGQRCPQCSLKSRANKRRMTQLEFASKVEELVGTTFSIMSEYLGYTKPIKMKHNICGYVWDTTPVSFLNSKNHCPHCFNKYKRGSRKTNDQFKQEVFDLVGNEYTFLEKYKNDKAPILCKHNKCGYTWRIKPNSFLNGNRCPRCRETQGERSISKYLDKLGLLYDYGYRMSNKLHLDFYLADKSIAIEYDGIQHFQPIDFAGRGKDWAEEQFRNTQKRDHMKDAYCKEKHIKLIRIPYTEKVNEVLDKQLLPLLK